MTTLSAAIIEVKLELAKRRQVWTRIPGEDIQFIDQEHQRRYGVLADLLIVLQHMQTKEYGAIVTRILRNEADKDSQTHLF